MNETYDYQYEQELNTATTVDQLNLYLKDVDFNFCFIMIIFPIAIVVNSLQVYIFTRKELNKKTNMGNMHALLSLYNLIAIIFSILLTQLMPFLKVFFKRYSDFNCKLLSYLQRVALDIASFQQIMITLIFFCEH